MENPSTKSSSSVFKQQQRQLSQAAAAVAAAAAASRQWYSNKADMLPFLSLCSRYPGGPWAGLLQQTMKEKQKGRLTILESNPSNIFTLNFIFEM